MTNHAIFELLDRPIAFHRSFVTITGSVTAALFLSQAIYWSRRTSDPDGWFYKSREEWAEETGMTRREQETARSKLRTLCVLEEKQVGVQRVMWYRVDTDTLYRLLVPMERRESARSIGTNPPNGKGGIQPMLRSETTSETTSNKDSPLYESSPQSSEKPTYPAEYLEEQFEWFWGTYPRRRGTNPKAPARKRFMELVTKRGVDPERLSWTADRYWQAMYQAGMIGTEYVQQAATFLGPGKETYLDYLEKEDDDKDG